MVFECALAYSLEERLPMLAPVVNFVDDGTRGKYGFIQSVDCWQTLILL